MWKDVLKRGQDILVVLNMIAVLDFVQTVGDGVPSAARAIFALIVIVRTMFVLTGKCLARGNRAGICTSMMVNRQQRVLCTCDGDERLLDHAGGCERVELWTYIRH